MAAGIAWGTISALPFSSWWVGGSLIFGGLVALATIIVQHPPGQAQSHPDPRPEAPVSPRLRLVAQASSFDSLTPRTIVNFFRQTLSAVLSCELASVMS